jgi:serine/threonine protein kinase
MRPKVQDQAPGDVTKTDAVVMDPTQTGESPATAQELSNFDAGARIGNYEILATVARGGMGVVYKARQISLNRTVALKMILPGQLGSLGSVERFRIEAESAAKLDHPGIVSVYDHGEQQGQHYIAMAWVEGENLASRTKRGPLPVEETVRIVRDAALAIEHAHERGIVHRDLKPANVLIDPTGRVQVTDFGLARRIERLDGLTLAGEIVGTPAYMSPEQAAGRVDQVGPSSDVYALGAVLYFLLTGHPPFEGSNPLEVIRRVCDEVPSPPQQIRANVSAEVGAICLRCLEKDPVRRYPSAAALAADLDRANATRQSPATMTIPASRQQSDVVSPSPVRGAAARVAGGIVIVALLALAGFGIVKWVRGEAHDAPAATPASPGPQFTTNWGPGLSSAEPLDGTIDVRVWNPNNPNRARLSLSDPGALPLRTGDEIRVEARTNRQAYLYVIWIDTNGLAKPVYPWKPGQWDAEYEPQKATAKLSLPGQIDGGWPIEGGPGMETLVLLGRDQPLPADATFKDWFAGLPMQRSQSQQLLVYLDQGEISRSRTRGADFAKVMNLNDPVLTSQRLLAGRFKPYFPLIRAVSFANRGR